MLKVAFNAPFPWETHKYLLAETNRIARFLGVAVVAGSHSPKVEGIGSEDTVEYVEEKLRAVANIFDEVLREYLANRTFVRLNIKDDRLARDGEFQAYMQKRLGNRYAIAFVVGMNELETAPEAVTAYTATAINAVARAALWEWRAQHPA